MKVNLKNLEKLVNHLENNVKNKEFDITFFRSNEYAESVNFFSIHDCGTIGCAIGHMPFIDGLEPIHAEFSHNFRDGLDFFQYTKRILNISYLDRLFDYMFSSEWGYTSTTQSSRKGTIRRIKKVIENDGKLTNDMIRTMKKYNIG